MAQADLAAVTGMSIREVQAIERGEVAVGLLVMTKLAEAFEVAPITLLDNIEPLDDMADLSGRAVKMAHAFDKLDVAGQEAVEGLVGTLGGRPPG